MTQELSPPETFLLVAARSGVTCVVGENESIADCLLRHGVKIRIGCLSGACGTCISQVLEGEPDHQDIYLTEVERRAGKIAICCSRSNSARLVLDL